MPIDIEKYRKHLASKKLDKADEEEIIRIIYAFMDEFLSAEFGKHPVQQAVDEKKRKSLQRQDGMIDSRDHNSTQHVFKDTADRWDQQKDSL